MTSLACGGRPGTLLPDGGRASIGCFESPAVVVVKVVDAAGSAVEGATVTAKNVGTGKTVTATTNGAGITNDVTDTIGTGTVRLTAETGTGASQTAQVEFTCSDCSCSVSPQSLTLQLSP
ncbi:MAG: carboxypeptidase-like regulatory domain-containing protein [Myxococcaceae bacterium]